MCECPPCTTGDTCSLEALRCPIDSFCTGAIGSTACCQCIGTDCDVTPDSCGACCNHDGSCEDGVAKANCSELGDAWFFEAACAGVNCTAVPTVSEWALIVMTLIGCTIGSLVYRSRRMKLA